MASLDARCLAWLRSRVCSSLKVSKSSFDACLAYDTAQDLVAAFLAGEGETLRLHLAALPLLRTSNESMMATGSEVRSLFFQCEHVRVGSPRLSVPHHQQPALVDDSGAGCTAPPDFFPGDEILSDGVPVAGEMTTNASTADAPHEHEDIVDHNSLHPDTSIDMTIPVTQDRVEADLEPQEQAIRMDMMMASKPAVSLLVSHVRQREVLGGTLFAVRRHDEALTEDNIHESVDIGTFPAGEPLTQVSGLLQQVFAPLLSRITGANRDKMGDNMKSQIQAREHSAADTELSAALEKYVSQLQTSEAHLTGSVKLCIPTLDATAMASRNDDTVTTLESCMHEWTLVLQEVKLAEAEKAAPGDGPLDEIHFWREKNNIWGGLHEQIHLSRAQRIIECVSDMMQGFNAMSKAPETPAIKRKTMRTDTWSRTRQTALL